jgi:hypothetical protein
MLPQCRGFTITVTPHWVRLLSTSDQPDAGTYIPDNIRRSKDTSTRRRDSNPMSQNPSVHRSTRGQSDRYSQIYVLIQSQCPQFSQWSLSKWCSHQDTTRIYFPIKATRPAHRDTFVLIPFSVLFKDNVNRCGYLASKADERKWVWSIGDMTTRENRVPLPLWPPQISYKMVSDKTWASGVRRRLQHGMGLLKLLMSYCAIFSPHWIRVSLTIRQKFSKQGRTWQPYEYWAILFKTSWLNFSRGTKTHFRFSNQYVTRWQ